VSCSSNTRQSGRDLEELECLKDKMYFSTVHKSVAAVFVAMVVDAVPNIDDLGAATILTDNDLYGI